MDFNALIARVKALLLTPKAEWAVIAAEPATVGSIYTKFIVVMAAIPAIMGFLKGSLIGYSVPFIGTTFRVPIISGLTGMVIQFGVALLGAFLFMLVIDALAPTFGGQKNQVQALKAAAYTATPVYVASVLQVLPMLGALILLAAGVYGVYQLYLGLQATMQAPVEKAVGYTGASIVVAIVLAIVVNVGLSAIGFGFGGRSMMSGIGAAGGSEMADLKVDPKSAAGQLAGWSERIAAAGAAAEAAQKSGDPDAAAKAAGAAVATVLGGDPNAKALSTDQLKEFVPETLLGMKRSSLEANRSGAMGMETAEVEARYANDAGQSVRLKIQDLAFAKGMMALAGRMGAESERTTDDGYEKAYSDHGRWVQEKWNGKSKNGSYAVVIAQRFSIEVDGDAGSFADLKAAVGALDLAGLEALKNEGRKAP